MPEIGEDLPETNPLLRDDGLLEFSNVSIEKCVSLIGKQAIDLERNVQLLESTLSGGEQKPVDIFRDVIDPLERFWAPLETTWGLAKTLYLGNSTLMPTKSFSTIHDRAQKARVAKFNSLPIYNAIKAAYEEVSSSPDVSEEQRRLLDKYLLEGRLNGLELNAKNKDLFTETMVKLKKERGKFQANVDRATNSFKNVITDFEMVREFPVDVLGQFAADSKQPTQGPWMVTLKPDSVHRFLEYCPNRTERWNVWQAANRCASTHIEKAVQNSTTIEEIRFLRRDQASILGFGSFLDLSMETKMASGVPQLKDTINAINEFAKPRQEAEVEQLLGYARENGFKQNALEFHDIPFWRRKHLLSKNYDEFHVQEYFPLQKVMSGLFQLSSDLFKIKIVERESSGFDRWHEDVRYFDVFDLKDTSQPVGGFYLDLYSRDTEKPVAQQRGWTIGVRNRSQLTGSAPLAAMIFNFPAERVYKKPCLLTLRDVHLLFERFGYALQHLLTRAHYSDVAGVSNIEWDAVNISSYVLSQFLYEPKVLSSISSHYKTADPLSEKLIEGIQRKRTHMAGFDVCQELFLSALDVELHTTKEFWPDVMRRLWEQFQVLPLDKKNSHPCSWSTVFSGAYGGAYFSDIWSRMVATDVYSAFYEAKGEEKRAETGERYKDTFLALGGSCSPSEVFRRFRGRDPSPRALISALDLNKTKVD